MSNNPPRPTPTPMPILAPVDRPDSLLSFVGLGDDVDDVDDADDVLVVISVDWKLSWMRGAWRVIVLELAKAVSPPPPEVVTSTMSGKVICRELTRLVPEQSATGMTVFAVAVAMQVWAPWFVHLYPLELSALGVRACGLIWGHGEV